MRGGLSLGWTNNMGSNRILVMDNGANTIKAGYSTADSCNIISNSITKAKNERKRIFIGDQIKDCKDLSSLYFILPFQKGYLVNFETEHQIWDYVFGKDVFQVDFDETCLVLTEPHFNFTSIQELTNEIIFEDYQFQSALRVNSTTLSAYKYLVEHPEELCYLVVDAGYSFTHIVPYCKGRKITDAIVRIDVGGKALTNYLKEVISYRQVHVMEETYVINQCKEDVCFVSSQFNKDMQIAKSTKSFVKEYVLPDFTTIQRGYVKKSKEFGQNLQSANTDEQVVVLNHERFSIPEILFHPSDVGVNEMGLPESIAYSILNKCPEIIHPHLTKNIVLTGGCCCFDGFKTRLESDVRSLIPDDYDVRTFLPNDPISYAWLGGCLLTQSNVFNEMLVTREKYNECGQNICNEKFDV